MGDEGTIIDYSAGREPSRRWRVPPIAAAGMLLVALVPFAWFMHQSGRLVYVLSGQLFRSEFDPSVVGNALDQPTIGKQFVLFALFAAPVLPYILIVRWLSDRRTRAGYWAFALPTIGLCACLLILLTVPSYWLLQYVHAMGSTPRRVRGLVFSVVSYIVVLALLSWQLRPPTRVRAAT